MMTPGKRSPPPDGTARFPYRALRVAFGGVGHALVGRKILGGCLRGDFIVDAGNPFSRSFDCQRCSRVQAGILARR